MEHVIALPGNGGLLVYDLGPMTPAGGGCILELTLTLRSVSPEARTALAFTLTELDEQDREFPRGVRTLLVPAHHGEAPVDIPVRDVRFILPAELDVGAAGGRRFRVRAECHCVDCPMTCMIPPPL